MIVIFAILVIYLLVTFVISWGAFRTLTKTSSQKKDGFTVVIPFKNEAERIPVLLHSIAENAHNDANIQFLFINDHSADQTNQLIEQILPNSSQYFNNGYGKKAAITTAIEKASYSTIITLDADAQLPKNYWQLLYHLPSTKMIVGPVYIQSEPSFINALDRLEQLSIQTLASGSLFWKKPLSASGAHLIYQKEEFSSVNGFLGNEHIPSGDDMFLLQKFEKARYPIQYWNQPAAIVKVEGTSTLREFLYQKMRWGGKMKHLTSIYPRLLGLLIFSANLVFIIGLFSMNFHQILIILMLKWISDLLVYFKGQSFFKDNSLHAWVPFLLIIYPFYQVITIVLSQVVPTKNWNLEKK